MKEIELNLSYDLAFNHVYNYLEYALKLTPEAPAILVMIHPVTTMTIKDIYDLNNCINFVSDSKCGRSNPVIVQNRINLIESFCRQVKDLDPMTLMDKSESTYEVSDKYFYIDVIDDEPRLVSFSSVTDVNCPFDLEAFVKDLIVSYENNILTKVKHASMQNDDVLNMAMDIEQILDHDLNLKRLKGGKK